MYIAYNMPCKVDFAADASRKLIEHIHSDGTDKCCIVTFNNKYTKIQRFTHNKIQALESCERVKVVELTGSAQLYQSIRRFIEYFNEQNDYNPRMIIVVTNGYGSVTNDYNRSDCLRHIRESYITRKNSFMFVATMGDAFDVNHEDMNYLRDSIGGNFFHKHTDGYSFEAIFLKTAFQLLNSIATFPMLNNHNWESLWDLRQSTQTAINYGILVDTSQKMGNIVHVPTSVHVNKLMSHTPVIERIINVFCFHGAEELCEHHYDNEQWHCDVCGKMADSNISYYHCMRCGLDVCPTHCLSGQSIESAATCRKGHPMFFRSIEQRQKKCNECLTYIQGDICITCTYNCNYALCQKCLNKNTFTRHNY